MSEFNRTDDHAFVDGDRDVFFDEELAGCGEAEDEDGLKGRGEDFCDGRGGKVVDEVERGKDVLPFGGNGEVAGEVWV